MVVEHEGRTYVVTGADSGIGAAVCDVLERGGARALRCGLGDDAEVRADLRTAEGRVSLLDDVRRLAPDGVDGVALVAGIGAPSAATVRLNYFGTLTVLAGLRPLLLASGAPRAAIVSSASALSAGDRDLVEALLHGDEEAAVSAAERAVARGRGATIYRSTKIGLNRWARRNAGGADWAGSGIPVNVVAPGIVDTETARASMLADPAQVKVLADALPQPLGMPGPVQAVADAIGWLVGPANSFMVGQVVHIDGGADAILRSDEPYMDGARYGRLAMARMVFWSLVARAQARRDG